MRTRDQRDKLEHWLPLVEEALGKFMDLKVSPTYASVEKAVGAPHGTFGITSRVWAEPIRTKIKEAKLLLKQEGHIEGDRFIPSNPMQKIREVLKARIEANANLKFAPIERAANLPQGSLYLSERYEWGLEAVTLVEKLQEAQKKGASVSRLLDLLDGRCDAEESVSILYEWAEGTKRYQVLSSPTNYVRCWITQQQTTCYPVQCVPRYGSPFRWGAISEEGLNRLKRLYSNKKAA